jgi:hypothetical protein
MTKITKRKQSTSQRVVKKQTLGGSWTSTSILILSKNHNLTHKSLRISSQALLIIDDGYFHILKTKAHRLGMVACACNPRAQKAEVGG